MIENVENAAENVVGNVEVELPWIHVHFVRLVLEDPQNTYLHPPFPYPYPYPSPYPFPFRDHDAPQTYQTSHWSFSPEHSLGFVHRRQNHSPKRSKGEGRENQRMKCAVFDVVGVVVGGIAVAVAVVGVVVVHIFARFWSIQPSTKPTRI